MNSIDPQNCSNSIPLFSINLVAFSNTCISKIFCELLCKVGLLNNKADCVNIFIINLIKIRLHNLQKIYKVKLFAFLIFGIMITFIIFTNFNALFNYDLFII